jgi:hypothetical protein
MTIMLQHVCVTSGNVDIRITIVAASLYKSNSGTRVFREIAGYDTAGRPCADDTTSLLPLLFIVISSLLAWAVNQKGYAAGAPFTVTHCTA